MLKVKPKNLNPISIAEAELLRLAGTEETVNNINGTINIPNPYINNGTINVSASASVVNRKYIHV